MKIPKFWSKASAEEVDASGTNKEFTAWRWSDRSEEDAYQSALAVAKQALRAIFQGERPAAYSYGTLPLREEVLDRFNDATGEPIAAVTRNHYGSLILNSARVMFIDVDFPYTPTRKRLAGWFQRMLNRGAPTPAEINEANARERFERFIGEHAGWSLRLYRTAAGMRGIVTHELFDPTAEATIHLLNAFGADPLFVRLCKGQECFRARLTPKPWRCGGRRDPPRWPREGISEQRFAEWLAEYETRQAGFATCRFVATLGTSAVHPEAQHMLRIHDELTRCNEPLALA
jgi:hypothetical protein